jgi:hypothetical protein
VGPWKQGKVEVEVKVKVKVKVKVEVEPAGRDLRFLI